MSFMARTFVTQTCFQKVRCHIRLEKLVRMLCFQRHVIYSTENCSEYLILDGSLPFMAWKFAALTCFSKARCHVGLETLVGVLCFQRLDVI